jgi:hypothetical protein
MFGVAAFGGKTERQAAGCLSTWTRDYLRQVALADLGCAVVGMFMAARVRFGSNVTPAYLALSLALPMLGIAAFEAEACSSSAKIRASPWWERTHGTSPWTGFRSCSAYSPATWRWWGRGLRFLTRRRNKPSMAGAGCWSSLA